MESAHAWVARSNWPQECDNENDSKFQLIRPQKKSDLSDEFDYTHPDTFVVTFSSSVKVHVQRTSSKFRAQKLINPLANSLSLSFSFHSLPVNMTRVLRKLG